MSITKSKYPRHEDPHADGEIPSSLVYGQLIAGDVRRRVSVEPVGAVGSSISIRTGAGFLLEIASHSLIFDIAAPFKHSVLNNAA